LQDSLKYSLEANGNIRYKAQEDKYRPVFCSKGYSKRSDASGNERDYKVGFRIHFIDTTTDTTSVRKVQECTV